MAQSNPLRAQQVPVNSRNLVRPNSSARAITAARTAGLHDLKCGCHGAGRPFSMSARYRRPVRRDSTSATYVLPHLSQAVVGRASVVIMVAPSWRGCYRPLCAPGARGARLKIVYCATPAAVSRPAAPDRAGMMPP